MGDVKLYFSEVKRAGNFTHGLCFSINRLLRVENLIFSQIMAFHGQKLTLSPKGLSEIF